MSKTKTLIYCSLFTALIAVGAFIKIPVPVVPFTLQYLFTMLAGLLLGSRRGTISVVAYMLLGLAGLPIFSEGGGLWYVFKPSFGYIIGFCLGTYVTGRIAEHLKKKTVFRYLFANLAGLMVVYACGMIYYYIVCNYVINTPIGIWPLILYCFLLAVPGDIALSILGAVLQDVSAGCDAVSLYAKYTFTKYGGNSQMNPLTLAEEIINGRRITREDDLSFFLTCDLDELCEGADRIRAACIGDRVDLCSIINGRSGRCPEDCKYCAQSAHHHTSCEVYDFLPEEEILEACKMNESEGVDRFSIVTAGKALTGKEFDQAIHAYETMHRECKIDLCASMGFLSAEQLHRLHEAGVTSYHHNIETSRRNFPNICTTHTYDMKIETLKKVKAEGMCACSGGIIGMGETWEDRLDMAVSLAELGIDSIPINALMPIPGTPLEHLPELSEPDILRTIAFFRYINPEANIRLAAGRALLTNDGETAFKAGASASITGNMLTTVACATIRSDRQMLADLGRQVKPVSRKDV